MGVVGCLPSARGCVKKKRTGEAMISKDQNRPDRTKTERDQRTHGETTRAKCARPKSEQNDHATPRAGAPTGGATSPEHRMKISLLGMRHSRGAAVLPQCCAHLRARSLSSPQSALTSPPRDLRSGFLRDFARPNLSARFLCKLLPLASYPKSGSSSHGHLWSSTRE